MGEIVIQIESESIWADQCSFDVVPVVRGHEEYPPMLGIVISMREVDHGSLECSFAEWTLALFETSDTRVVWTRPDDCGRPLHELLFAEEAIARFR